MEKFISLGTPCGKLDESERYYILFRDKLYGMPQVCYSLWNSFGCGNSFDVFLAEHDAKEMGSKELTNSYEDLKRLNLIVRLKDAIHYLPIRQGIGLGFNENNSSYVVQCLNCKVTLPFLCYFTWCYADGKTSLMDIRQSLRKQGVEITDEVFVNAFYQVLMTEALTLV